MELKIEVKKKWESYFRFRWVKNKIYALSNEEEANIFEQLPTFV